ncbi:MAG: hypothetical protein KOO62_03470 [candidate division Zixibacteria bacterium]|nr:hypothetical protein [candidate division Zixibacteria bacterium]
MTRRANWLLLTTLTIIGAGLYVGCSQPDDLLSPISRTSLTLSAQMLPDCPESMNYELWVVDDGNYLSLGKFGYSFAANKFLDEVGIPRGTGAEFIMEGDLLDYDSICISVEAIPDDDELTPGSLMLVDAVTIPSDDLIELVFPYSDDSLWYATCRYNMQTMSDTARGANTGAGLWLASYQTRTRLLQDTVTFDSFVIDSSYIDITDPDTTIVVGFVSIGIVTDTIMFGLDWYEHTGLQYEIVTETHLRDPAGSTLVTEVLFYLDTLPSIAITFDAFTQDDFDLPDYSAFGWHYKIWAVAPTVLGQGFSVGQFTLPAWANREGGLDRILGYDGGMISAGTFTDVTTADDDSAHWAIFSNDYPPSDPALLPYVSYARVPSFPGDEFFNVPAQGGGTGMLDLLQDGGEGTVFISLEPDNFVTDTTNFPLIPFIRRFPQTPPSLDDVQQETMDNLTHTNDPYWGFPKVSVEVQRY